MPLPGLFGLDGPAAALVLGAAAGRSPSECCLPFLPEGRLLETRFRFSMSERRSGAAAVCEVDDEGAEAAPAPEASDADEVSRELLELINDKMF